MLSTATTASEVQPSVTVRVYQAAGLSSTVEQRALDEAESVLRAALVDVRWQPCPAPNVSAACQAPPGPSELVLRIVPEGTTRRGWSATLGEAVLDRPEGSGVLATVYFNRVAWAAKVTKTDVAVLLGRVIAHELGHLMLRTSGHARGGLMRPKWSASELRRNRAADWSFTAEDVAAMRQPGLPY